MIWILIVSMLPAVAIATDSATYWQFFFPEANPPVEPVRSQALQSVPGSTQHFTHAQADNLMSPPDWFPQGHPVAPKAVVSGGEKPPAFACGGCHLMNGMGRPESASLTGQPVGYMLQQMADFKSGARTSNVVVDGKPVIDGVKFMAMVAKAWSDDEVLPALQYFASLKPQRWVQVVETDTVPKTYINPGFMRVIAAGGEKEPLGQRIVELAQDHERQLLRDPNSGTVAYVPMGSVARGKALVARATVPCTSCHGPDLKGMANFPAIAGRSPVYAARQLYLFKEGTRNGPLAATMKDVTSRLSEQDMIDVAAYVATLEP